MALAPRTSEDDQPTHKRKNVKTLIFTHSFTLYPINHSNTLYVKAILEEMKKKVREKFRECHNHKPLPRPELKRKRKPTNLNKHTNRTNVRKELRLALSSPSEVIAILKGLKNTRTKWHTERHTTNRLVE